MAIIKTLVLAIWLLFVMPVAAAEFGVHSSGQFERAGRSTVTVIHKSGGGLPHFIRKSLLPPRPYPPAADPYPPKS